MQLWLCQVIRANCSLDIANPDCNRAIGVSIKDRIGNWQLTVKRNRLASAPFDMGITTQEVFRLLKGEELVAARQTLPLTC